MRADSSDMLCFVEATSIQWKQGKDLTKKVRDLSSLYCVYYRAAVLPLFACCCAASDCMLP